MDRICIIASSMLGGGAEKMVSYICNKLLEDNNKQVILILFQKKGINLIRLNESLQIIDLNKKLGISGIFKLVKILKKIKPSVVFFTLGPLNAVFSPFIFFFKETKFIARETNIPSLINKLQAKKKKIYKLVDVFYKTTYKLFDLIIAQSEDMKLDLQINYKIIPDKIVVINNLIDVELIKRQKNTDLNKIKYLYQDKKIYGIAIGRLTEQKGYDLLLKRLKNINSDVVIYILGDGELKMDLLNKAKEYKLDKNFKILPFDTNPYKYLMNSHFFILSSRIEGFPNALIEALACGVPALVNNCKGGINEIIKDGFNGKIVDFNHEFNIMKEINNIIEYDRDSIMKDAIDRFSKDKILDQYINILK